MVSRTVKFFDITNVRIPWQCPVVGEPLKPFRFQRSEATDSSIGIGNVVSGPVSACMTSGLCIQAVSDLLHESLLRISNADRKGGNSFLPILSALLRMPIAAFALKKYRSGTGCSSKRSDNEDSAAALGDAEVSTVKYSPRDIIPEVGQRP